MLPFAIPALLATRKAKLIAGAVAMLVVCALVAYTVTRIYRAGFTAGQMEAVVQIASARLQAQQEQAEIQRKLIETEHAMRGLEQQAASLIEKLRRAGEVQVRTVERVIRENPDFAAVQRPAELDRVRQQQLAAIAAAAARGANTTTELPGAGLPALPRSRIADSDHARPD